MRILRDLLMVKHQLDQEYRQAQNHQEEMTVSFLSSNLNTPLLDIMWSVSHMLTPMDLSEEDRKEYNSIMFELSNGDVQRLYNPDTGEPERGFGAGHVNVDAENERLNQRRELEENQRLLAQNQPFMADNLDDPIHPRAQG